jgi:hypothetical protein
MIVSLVKVRANAKFSAYVGFSTALPAFFSQSMRVYRWRYGGFLNFGPSKTGIMFVQPNSSRWTLLLTLLVAGMLYRMLVLIPNVAPVSALALLGAAYSPRKSYYILALLAAYWGADLYINNVVYAQWFPTFTWFHESSSWVYGSMLMIFLLGQLTLKKIRATTLLLNSVGATLLFFLITNFGSWATSGLYPQNAAGLLAAYVAGLPFLGYTLLGDLVFVFGLFGVYSMWYKTSAKAVYEKTNS